MNTAINVTLWNYKTVSELANAFLEKETKGRIKKLQEDVFEDGRNNNDFTLILFLQAASVLLERESFDFDDLSPLMKLGSIENFGEIEKLYNRWTRFLESEGKVKRQNLIIMNYPRYIKLF